MRKLMILGAAVAATLLSGARADTPQTTDHTTVHGLYQSCTDKDLFGRGYCLGFIQGVAIALAVAGPVMYKDPQLKRLICTPEHATNQQVIQAFTNWHDKHPERWQDTSIPGVVAAVNETWPCNKTK